MGCFNVACSMSNLSIGHGTEVAFFLLWPYKYSKNKNGLHTIHPTSIISQDGYFFPFCLPIFGSYNDYGSVEKIREDRNTKALEKFFGISIDQIVDAVTSNFRCGVSSPRSVAFQAFCHCQHLFENYAKLSEQWLFDIGFVKETLALREADWPKEIYKYRDFPYYVSLYTVEAERPEYQRISYRIHDENFVVLSEGIQGEAQYFVAEFSEITDYHVHIPEDKQEVVSILQSMSAMFVHRRIYDLMVNMLAEDVNVGIREKSDIVKEVRSDIEKLCIELRTYAEHIPKKVKGKYPSAEIQKQLYDHRAEIARLVENPIVEPFVLHPEGEEYEEYERLPISKDDPFGFFGSFGRESSYFSYNMRYWDFFKKIYREALTEGSEDIIQAFVDYCVFDASRYSCNRFYFPGYNGEQHGNLKASRALLVESLAIVDEEIAEQQQYLDEDDDDENDS